MKLLDLFSPDLDFSAKIILLLVLTVGTHVMARMIRALGGRLAQVSAGPALRKLRSVASLATSALVFTAYFLALGLILREFGVSLTSYLASASIIGLAVGFGSQGVVQDVVTGLTLIFSDLFDIGEMVEISGQSGIVKNIGMRFVVLENSYGAAIYIPNRTVTNVINYPRGYVRCIADVTLSGDAQMAEAMEKSIRSIAQGVYDQFPGILLTPPTIEGRNRTTAGKEFLRVKFRIWPGRGDPIEKTFRQETLQSLRALEPDYPEWSITVYYEVERKLSRTKH